MRTGVAPWRSVYKVHLQADVDVTFALTTGGHNVGIVNPPTGSQRAYRIGTPAHGRLRFTRSMGGSPRSHSWIVVARLGALAESKLFGVRNATGNRAPAIGLNPIEAAPGSYVFDR